MLKTVCHKFIELIVSSYNENISDSIYYKIYYNFLCKEISLKYIKIYCHFVHTTRINDETRRIAFTREKDAFIFVKETN